MRLSRWLGSRAFVFAVVAILFGIATGGHLRLSPDAYTYLRMSDAVRQGKIGIFLATSQANFTIIVIPLLLGALRTIAPEHWHWIVLALNVISAAVTAVLLISVVRSVTSSVAAPAAALLFYTGCSDILVWVTFLLTDHIYTIFATAVFVLTIRDVAGIPDGAWRRTKLVLVLLLAVISRPVGFMLVPLVVLSEWLLVERQGRRRPAAAWLLVLLGIAAGLLIHAYIYQDVSRWPLRWMKPKLQEYAAREKTGEVVWDRHETFHQPPVTFADHLSIEADRFVRFFQATSTAFSRRHNLVSLLYYLPLYLLGLIGVVDAFRQGGDKRRAVVHVALLWLVVMDGLSAMTILDYDWRYRLPLMPQFIFLAACGVDALARRRAVTARTEAYSASAR
jgi:hypothetical protein